MSILFSNAILWPLLALIALPLIIHLFARARPPAYRFSSVEFVRRVARTAQRIRRPRDWLLWLIRTGVMAALVFLFLKPLLFADRRLAAPNEPRTVIVIVDASASMAVLDGAQSRFVAACAEANDLLAGLPDRDRANLIWLRAAPEPVFPAPGVNLRYLRDALRQARVSNEAGHPREALRLAVDMLRDLEGRKEIYIVSDFQATNWAGQDLAVPADVQMARVRIGEGPPENMAVTRIHTEPALPLAGEPVTLFCEVQNFSPRHRRTPVYFSFRETRERQEVALGPWERTTVLFAAGAAPAGAYPATVQIGEDEFPGDNARHAILRYRPYLRAGIYRGEPETAEAWRRALEASGFIDTAWMNPGDQETEEPFDALLLAGWNGADGDALKDYLRNGGLVLWYPAPNTAPARLADLTGRALAPNDERPWNWQTPSRNETFRLRIGERDDPVFSIFAGGEFGDPARGVFLGRLNLSRPADRNVRVLLWFEDDVPALVRYQTGEGRLFLWNLPLQPEAGDWAARPEFLPFLCELIMHNRGRAPGDAWRTDHEPGSPLTYRPAQDALAEDMALRDPAGAIAPVERRETDQGPLFISAPASEPGVYTWLYRDEPVWHSAVNFPAIESDLRAGETDFGKEQWVDLESGREAQALREGRELWPTFLGILFALAMVEAVTLLGGRRP